MDKRSKLKPDFNEVLLEAINEALSSLGENAAKSIYFHVEKTFSEQKVTEFIETRIRELET